MTLPLPTLDNRSYDELVREGQRVLRRQPSAWTDHNAHDPGVTLIELFSWMVEQDVYRLDRTPDASIRAFLRLVGVVPRPPQVAQTVVELMPQSGVGALDLSAGQVVSDAESRVAFATASAVQLTEACLVSVNSVEHGELNEQTAANTAVGTIYHPLGSMPEADNALVLDFDAAPAAAGNTVSLYVWTADPQSDAETRARLIDEQQRAAATAAGACEQDFNIQSKDWRLHYSARTCWEYQNSSGTWAALSEVEDETRALSLSGFVRFAAPADQGVRRIRCRLVTGRYECPPAIDRIAHNAVVLKHEVEIAGEESIGTSNARAGQSFQLANAPVVAGSVRVGEAGDADNVWFDVATWDRIGPHDRVLLLDPVAAGIYFGDGRAGRVPSADAELVCRYKVGGGTDGNVAAGTLVVAEGLPIDAAQRFSANGGTAAETLDDAKGRALQFLAGRERAITLGDFETLAVATPGVPVARARALAGYHPTLPCVPAAGSVTVVAVPQCPGERPEAGEEFLAAVSSWLLQRCPLTTELHVIGPCYQVVAVQARLHAAKGTDLDALAELATAELERFLHPLAGGPDGRGWPVGRDVYRSEVMAVLNGIDCVTHVDSFRLIAEGEAQASCTNIPICPDCMAASGEHLISVIDGRPPR